MGPRVLNRVDLGGYTHGHMWWGTVLLPTRIDGDTGDFGLLSGLTTVRDRVEMISEVIVRMGLCVFLWRLSRNVGFYDMSLN